MEEENKEDPHPEEQKRAHAEPVEEHLAGGPLEELHLVEQQPLVEQPLEEQQPLVEPSLEEVPINPLEEQEVNQPVEQQPEEQQPLEQQLVQGQPQQVKYN